MDPVANALSRIETSIHRFRRSALLSALQPGLDRARIGLELDAESLPATRELESLYGWKDGTNTNLGLKLGEIYIHPGFYLLSLESAASNHRIFSSDSRWNRNWLPLLADGGGDFYVVDLSSEFNGAIRHFRLDETDHPVEFESITAMLETIGEGFNRKIYFVDSDGCLDMDDAAFAELAAEMNPKVKWWTE